MAGNGGQQLIDAFDQRLTLGLVRQFCHQPLQHAEKLHLFTVFRLIDHLARLHRRRIVGANVVQQMQGLGRTFCGGSQQIEAARHQRWQQQPGEKTGGGSHE